MMKFDYFAGEQQSPEWFKIRIGKVTASRLEDWLGVSKRDGTPLKARLDYERELLFERTFNTTFERFVSGAMQEGMDYEDFARRQYEKITGNTVNIVGAWYNDYFCASPDGDVIEKGKKKPGGLLEIKWLKDTEFTNVLAEGPQEKYWKQMQGGMWASGRKWCDFAAGNLNSGKIAIIRVKVDPEFHTKVEKSITEELSVKEVFDTKNVYDFVDQPEIRKPALLNEEGREVPADFGF